MVLRQDGANSLKNHSRQAEGESGSRIMLMIFQMWFEMRATEEEKRVIWKKIQDAKKKGKTFDVSELGESQGLSWNNFYSEK